MADDKAWYLVARDADDNNNPVGMVHFRFDLDDGDEVLYWYNMPMCGFCFHILNLNFFLQIFDVYFCVLFV